MRRSVLIPTLLLGAGLTACSGFRDLFSAHADVAAEAGSQRLSSERLAEIMTSGKGIRPNRDAANFVTNVWIDYTLFAQAVANGKLPLDSASIAQGVWPQVAELKGSHWHDTLMARRSSVPPNAADSVYRGNEVRVLQHILYRVPPNAVPEVRNVARKKAEGTLARIKGGADFGQLASRLSEDPGSKLDRGFLPPSPKGRFVPAFDSAGWALAPGATSGVVETPFGYHIIKRPPIDAVRDRLTAYLVQSAGTRLDSIYMDSLAVQNQIKIEKGAASAMRKAADNPEAARHSTKKLATFKGGELTIAEFMRWIQALPPQYAAQLKQADDTMLTQFARVLSQNVLLLRQADSAKIQVTPAEWTGMAAGYRSQVDTLRTEMGLDTASLWDSTVAGADRDKVAAMKVDQYFERLLTGKSRLRPLPAALATLLRERSRYRIYDAGLNRAVELTQAERGKADSAKAKGPLQPAPGPAPIPGMTPGSESKPSQPAPGRSDSAAPKTPPPASQREAAGKRGDSATAGPRR
ncbi:MAG TPA: peptidylprolyl isomerase [Gemmatimonadales bacterium]|jgi:peptidyl-prolyl cis-trans isomerase D